MIYGERAGHTKTSPGSSFIVDEHTEALGIRGEVRNLLSPFNTLVNCQPPESYAYPSELDYGINVANNYNNKQGVDFFYSIHFNKNWDYEVNRAVGCEVWVYDRNSKLAIEKATRVLNNLKSLGFNNRGIKYLVEHEGKHLGELESTKMQAIIIEVCFVESKVDIDVYKSKGYKQVARAIANGLDNRVSLSTPTQSIKQHRNCIVYPDGSEKDKVCAEFLDLILNATGQDSTCISNKNYKEGMGRSVYAIGGALKNKIKAHVFLYGEDRYKTALAVLDRINGKK